MKSPVGSVVGCWDSSCTLKKAGFVCQGCRWGPWGLGKAKTSDVSTAEEIRRDFQRFAKPDLVTHHCPRVAVLDYLD